MSDNNIIKLPYHERQLICVVKNKEDLKSINYETIKKLGFKIITSYEPYILTIGKAIYDYYKSLPDSNLNIKIISYEESSVIKFPNGHPQNKIIYAGHPLVPEFYYQIADFHQFIFKHKFLELIEVLESIGAKTIYAKCVESNSKKYSSNINTEGIKDVADIDVEFGYNNQNSKKGEFKAEYPDNNSNALSENLVWYSSELDWQKIVKSKMERGMKKFSLNFEYTTDYGINLDLKTKLSSAGFGLGGEFKENKNTVWHFEGTF